MAEADDVPPIPAPLAAASALPSPPGYPQQPAAPMPPAYSAPPAAVPAQPGYPVQSGYPVQPSYPAQPGYPGQQAYPVPPGYAAPPTAPGYPAQPGAAQYGYPGATFPGAPGGAPQYGTPQYGAAQYGAATAQYPGAAGYPSYPGPARRRPVWPWVLGGSGLLVVAMLLIAGVIVVPLLVSSAQRSSVAGTPAQAIASYDRAWDDGDCALYEKLTTSEVRSQAFDRSGYSCAAFQKASDGYHVDGKYAYSMRVEKVSVDGSTATVRTAEVDSSGSSGSSDDSYELDYTMTEGDSGWTITAIDAVDDSGSSSDS